MPYHVISLFHSLGTQVIVISKDWPSPVELSQIKLVCHVTSVPRSQRQCLFNMQDSRMYNNYTIKTRFYLLKVPLFSLLLIGDSHSFLGFLQLHALMMYGKTVLRKRWLVWDVGAPVDCVNSLCVREQISQVTALGRMCVITALISHRIKPTHSPHMQNGLINSTVDQFVIIFQVPDSCESLLHHKVKVSD